MQVFAVAMQKGGVGKTALTTNVAAVLADRGHRVLVIDTDPQGHQARHFGIAAPENPTLCDVLFEKRTIASVAINVRERLDLVPGGKGLSAADVYLAGKPDGNHRMRIALTAVKDAYDFVLVDCPPNLGLLTLNALACASRPLVPVQTEQAAADSFAAFYETFTKVREFLNPDLKDPWIIPSLFQGNTSHQKLILGYLQNNPLRLDVLEPIRRTVKIAEAFAMGKPVYDHDRAASDGFERVAERIERS